MKPDISTLHKPDILTLQRQWRHKVLTNPPVHAYNALSPMTLFGPEVTDSPPSRRRAAEFLGPFTHRE